jgi:hypothetical protein
MPLQAGKRWTYLVTNSMTMDQKIRSTVQVKRVIPVGGVPGYELVSALGTSRLAWRGPELIASQMANTTFEPAIPLLGPVGSRRSWQGYVRTLGRAEAARATLETKADRLGERRTQKSTLRLSLPGRLVLVESWFEPGVGLVRQEQRTDGKLDLSLALKP